MLHKHITIGSSLSNLQRQCVSNLIQNAAVGEQMGRKKNLMLILRHATGDNVHSYEISEIVADRLNQQIGLIQIQRFHIRPSDMLPCRAGADSLCCSRLFNLCLRDVTIVAMKCACARFLASDKKLKATVRALNDCCK